MDSQSQVAVALALSLLGGLSTSFGALFVVINPAPNLKMLGLLQGYAAGLMLSISFFDLAHNALNSLGFLKGKLWFFAGVLFFGVVANFIPEPTLAPISTDKSRKRYQIFMNIIASLKLEKWGWRRQRYHEKASAKFDSVELLPQYKFAQLSRGNGSVPWFN
nr:zinc transporter ZTP29-like isoform X1 [Arachis hypogaea]